MNYTRLSKLIYRRHTAILCVSVCVSVGTISAQDSLFLPPVGYAGGDGPTSVVSADFNLDGFADIAQTNIYSNDVVILLNNGDGSFANGDSYATGAYAHAVATADVNSDGRHDLVVVNIFNDSVSVLFGNGDGSFLPADNYLVGDGPHGVCICDLDGDADYDLVVTLIYADSVAVLRNIGDGTFSTPETYATSGQPASVVFSDFNLDSHCDLAVSCRTSAVVDVFLNDTEGGLQPRVSYFAGSDPISVTAVDLEGDGDADLVVALLGANRVAVRENNGSGLFASAVYYTVGNQPHAVVAIDLDSDGDNDIVSADRYSHSVSVLLNNGDASFQASTPYLAGSDPNSVFAQDLDANGSNDLIVSNVTVDSVSVLFNTKTCFTLLEPAGEVSHLNVVSHTPTFRWSYVGSMQQERAEFEVGADHEWGSAELWASGIMETADTFITYGGGPLTDGMSYVVRVRIGDGVYWSNWYWSEFRMNSLPSIPTPLSPIAYSETPFNPPTLTAGAGPDAELDSQQVQFAVYHHAFVLIEESPPVPAVPVPEGDTVSWTGTILLAENELYFWTAEAWDGYEWSDSAHAEHFWVNAVQEAPEATSLLTPLADSIVYTQHPDFAWRQSDDPDPNDTVSYGLRVAYDSNFFVGAEIDSLIDTTHTLANEIDHSRRFWWKVISRDNHGLTSESAVETFRTYKPGDVDNNWAVTAADIIALVNWVFLLREPGAPTCVIDVNASGAVTTADIIHLVNHVFKGGGALAAGCE